MISVCIATYNGEKFIKEQLDSILLQLGNEDEIIISDDGSTDDTIKIAASYQDARIKTFRNSFKNLILNFEFALKQAKGEYIFLSDQDDIWMSNKVEICMNDFQKGYDLILSDCSIFDSASKVTLHPSFFDFNKSKRGIVNNIIKNSYIGCCMAFNNKVKNRVLPFPDNIPMHDSWIGINSELYYNVNFNKNSLIKYRKHSKNASDTSSGISKYSFLKKVSYRIITVYYLFLRFFVYKNDSKKYV